MNFEPLNKEIGKLINYVDEINDKDVLEENLNELNNVVFVMKKVMDKLKSISREKGISDSVKSQNFDALLQSINNLSLRRENAYYDFLDFQTAINELKRIINESTDCHVIASAYNGLGHVYAAKKYYEKALYNFEKVVDFYPSYIDGYFNLGAMYFKLKMYEEAAKEFNKVITLDKNEQETLLYLVVTYKKLGNNDMSRYFLKKYHNIKENHFSRIIS